MAAVTTESTLPINISNRTPSSSASEMDLVEWNPSNKARNVMIGSVLLLINGLTLVTVVRTHSLRPHTKLLVGSLTCTDMLMGIITLLPRLLPWHDLSHEPLCHVRFAFVLLSVYGSCLSLTAITLDRALALTFPILYRTSITMGKTLAAVGGVWGVSLLLMAVSMVRGFPPGESCDLILVLDTGGLLVMAYVLVGCVVVIVALYGFIGARLRKRKRQVQTELNVVHPQWGCTVGVRGVGESGGSGVVAMVGGGGHSQALSMKLEKRTTVTAIVLAVCFLMGYLPVAVYLLWVVHSGVDRFQEAKTQRLLIIIVCPLGNCILDPIVYFWRLQNWNSGIFDKCRRLVRTHDNSAGVVITQMTQRTAT